MNIYFAPLEGVTRCTFRNTYNKYYKGVDKFFAPFMSPADNCVMNPKEKKDILPENNEGVYLVPQILASKSYHFNAAAEALCDMGYKEINLNLGCPSGTVCSKGKGSGFLNRTGLLEPFLDDIFEYAGKMQFKLSIKTRIGYTDCDEWEEILDIYNKYPISELIIHPRLRCDFYKEPIRMEQFVYALKNSKNPIVYNGEINTIDDIKAVRKVIKENNPNMPDALMIGRGFLRNPEFIEEIRAWEKDNDKQIGKEDNASVLGSHSSEFDWKRFRKYHDDLYGQYKTMMSPDINVLFKMKEQWTYWREMFPDDEKTVKKILKAKYFSEYDIEVNKLF